MSGGVESEVKKQRAWPMVRLGDVCEVRAGSTHHGIESTEGKYPVYGSGGYICHATEFRCPANSVTIGRKGTLDNPLLIEEPFWNIDTCFGCTPNDLLDPRYLWRFCQNFDFYNLVPSLGRPSTNSEAIRAIQIPLPPLDVQREIVERLEKELGEAEKVAANFKKMVELADAEFKAELDETFKALENGEGEFLTQRYRGAEVQRVRLGEVCEIKTGKKDVNQGNVNGKYPFFTCARTPTRSDTYSFDCAALLIAGNGDVGYTQKYTGKFEAYQRTYVLSDFQNILLDYLYYALAALLKEHAGVNKKGSSMPYIKMGTLREFMFSYPSLEVQRTIVAKLDAAKERCEKLKAAAERGLKAAENLRKAILAEAFE